MTQIYDKLMFLHLIFLHGKLFAYKTLYYVSAISSVNCQRILNFPQRAIGVRIADISVICEISIKRRESDVAKIKRRNADPPSTRQQIDVCM